MASYRAEDPGSDDTARVVGGSGGAGGLVWKVATAVLALAVVALAYLLSEDSSRPGFADTPEGAAEAACDMLASAQEADLTGDGEEDEDEAMLFLGKLGLAQSFAFLAQTHAGTGSTEYDWLYEATIAPREVASRDLLSYGSEEVLEALQESVDTCADHGF